MEGICQGWLLTKMSINMKLLNQDDSLLKVERLSAGVDYPISLFWKDLVKMYPNAKVLFSNSLIVLGGL